jgi:hypothetical protein
VCRTTSPGAHDSTPPPADAPSPFFPPPQALPWSFKLLYGMLSDCVPVFGLRRKPYFLLGWLLYVSANVALALLGAPTVRALVPLVSRNATGMIERAVEEGWYPLFIVGVRASSRIHPSS